MMSFTHIDAEKNQPRMVDIADKKITQRFAHARSKVWLPESIRSHFSDGEIQTKKGPVFQTAIIAATMAVKNTAQIIPFCHSIKIESCSVDLHLHQEQVVIDCKVKSVDKTGVEMEALVGASVAALSVYDMCKAFSHDIRICETKLVEKSGGKSHFLSS